MANRSSKSTPEKSKEKATGRARVRKPIENKPNMAATLAEPQSPKTMFAAGERVTHRSFGSGVIIAITGDKLEIKFDAVGTKWIVDDYVKMK